MTIRESPSTVPRHHGGAHIHAPSPSRTASSESIAAASAVSPTAWLSGALAATKGDAAGAGSLEKAPKADPRVASLILEALLEPVELQILSFCQHIERDSTWIGLPPKRRVVQLRFRLCRQRRGPVVELETHALGLGGNDLFRAADFTKVAGQGERA